MDGSSMDSLRALAPKWSLAGDEQLLNLLQKTHEKIIAKCQDVNTKLDEMSSALNHASINLQNVNNKFMALSNSQFIESRVYDDDDDVVATEAPPVQESAPAAPDEVAMLKASLAILARAHDTAEILDDSDSDSDAEISVVLKPKDMYADRPLPYIIGSQQWKNKWHAGLIVEDSDTDSSTSKRDREADQYSDSESEEISRPPLEDNTLSESGSSFGGSLGAPASVGGAPAGAPLAAATPARPADIAAALARRLAVTNEPVTQRDPEQPTSSPAPAQTVRKMYKPEVPATSTIFLDEPPPLDEAESQSDDDIFAEINKHTPYTQKSRVRADVTEDLFSFDKPSVGEGDIFSDFAPENMEPEPVKQKSTLFEGESEPELFAEPPPLKDEAMQNNIIGKDEPSSKKPVGGISLFGSNKGTENIGAAILKRNQRKSSTSDDDSGSDVITNNTTNISKPIVQNKPKDVTRNNETSNNNNTKSYTDETDNTSVKKKEKDIFDDLFSKPDNSQKKPQKPIKESIKSVVSTNKTSVKEKEKTNVKDLFSDNLFDDIDDIFTSNVKIPNRETDNSKQKSIFDDDDLFSDIDVAKTSKSSKKFETSIKNEVVNKKSILDSDDDLFNDDKKSKPSESHKNEVTQKLTDNKHEIVTKTEAVKEPTEINKERNLFDDSPQTAKVTKPQMKSKSIFDSDSDSDDIFAKIGKSEDKKQNKLDEFHEPGATKSNNKELASNNKNLLTTDNRAPIEKSLIQSPSLFEEDEIDDLFITANKIKSQANEQSYAKTTHEINNPGTDQKSINSSYNATSVLSTVPELETPENKSLSEKITDPKLNEFQQHKDVHHTELPNKDATVDKDLEDDLFTTPKTISNDEPNDNNNLFVENVDVIESSQDIETETQKSSKISSKALKSKSEFADHEIVQDKVTESEHKDLSTASTNSVNFSNKETICITSEPKAPIPNADIFDDIFAEPPAFEKPVEPKKSKNVNALFDDDSDDESLFFKKNDGISDEKPEIFSNNAKFDIFVTEPPAIDVDFTSKTTKKSTVTRDKENLFNAESNSDTITSSDINEPAKQDKSVISENSDIENELFTTITNVRDVPNLSDNAISDKEVRKATEDLFATVPKIEENVPARETHKVNTNNIEDNKINQMFESKPQNRPFDDIEHDEDLFTAKTDKRIEKNTDSKNIDSDISKPNKVKSSDSDEELFSSLPSFPNVANKITETIEDIFKPAESPKKDADVKKIGKINTKNFNINVNALMPGASPKKVPKDNKDDYEKSIEEPKMVKIIPDRTDNQSKAAIKAENDETDQSAVNTDSEKEKTVTFDEKSESGVLDNKVSKQRARIQVKRRPSTRKARHEAARRSAIDFGDDTDNSSSFDEPKPKTRISNKTSDLQKVLPETTSSIETEKQKVSESNENVLKSNADVSETNQNVGKTNQGTSESEIRDVTSPLVTNQNTDKPTTTKIVYILNDEDIFNTDSTKSDKNPREFTKGNESKIFPNDDNADDLFKITPAVSTLGNTYKDTKESTEIPKTETILPKKVETTEKEANPPQKDKQSLFDDSDEELFGKKKEIKKKTTIFDSDSEEELFSGKKSKEKINKEQKNKEVKEKKDVKVKSSLFSDDDDDLFGLKKDNKSESKPKSAPSTSKEASAGTISSKTAEPVFSDPLSMLGNDD